MKHVNITITGSVQGVGFRYTAKNVAKSLLIKGFVKNLPNRSVYIEAEGDEPNIDEFISWCRKGPDRAHIQGISIIPGEIENYPGFDVAF